MELDLRRVSQQTCTYWGTAHYLVSDQINALTSSHITIHCNSPGRAVVIWLYDIINSVINKMMCMSYHAFIISNMLLDLSLTIRFTPSQIERTAAIFGHKNGTVTFSLFENRQPASQSAIPILCDSITDTTITTQINQGLTTKLMGLTPPNLWHVKLKRELD